MPVLGTGGRLDAVAAGLATLVAEALRGDEVAAARGLVPTDNREVATVVVAHELIWEVTEALIRTGTLRPPPGLRSGKAAPDTLVDLLYLNVGEV